MSVDAVTASRDPLRLGLAAHLTAWLLVGLVGFLAAGSGWFPAAPGARLCAALLVGGLALAAWPRATRRLWLWAVHSLSLAALALICLELLLGALHPGREEPSRYPFPYRMHGFAPERHAADNRHRASTNAAGLREPSPIAIPKPPATFRILVLGGSAMFGIGADDGASAPDQLEQLLAGQRRPPGIRQFEVVNAGQGWYNSTQELVYFVTELWRYEPDLVLVVDGYNDVHHSMVWRVPPPLNEVGLETLNFVRGLPGVWHEPAWEHALFLGLQASALRRWLGIPAERLFQPGSAQGGRAVDRLGDPREAEPLVFQQLLANWVALDALGDRQGFRVRFSLQPVIFAKQTITPEEARFFAEAGDWVPKVRPVWERLEKYVAERAPRQGLDVFQSDTFVRGSDRTLFLDYCHMVAEGYGLVARAMADAVKRDLESWH